MTDEAPRDFLREIVAADVAAGTHGGVVRTRFPPEPNGYLHIGHAKAICLDFGVAAEFGGACHLRMDDTNPETEDPRYVEAIARDVAWLGFEWEGGIRYASDYFSPFYRLALQLIRDGKAYVDSLSEEEIRELRGTVTEPGRPSPHRDRTPEESLELFEAMRAGEFADGAHVLRARIDMEHPNMKMRDPPLYRIRHARHYRIGDEWPIYPMYDWAHPLSDAIEGITHSFCTLEFEVNRPLYDWVVENTRPAAIGRPGSEAPGAWDPRPRQYEFARLNLDYTVMSKRKLLRLVQEGRVEGWDDPRMPTLAGLRRRGVPPESIRSFCDLVGISKADQRVDIGKLEYAIRDELNRRAPRVMGVVEPLRVVVTNFPEGEVDWLEAPHYPRDVEPPRDAPRSRRVPFTRILLVERDDFREEPPAGYRRLSPGREVRLRYGYFLRCDEVVRDGSGEVVELRCSYDPATRGGAAPDGRKPEGTIHWVSANEGTPCEVRLYDRLFSEPDPEAEGGDFTQALNPESLRVAGGARVEPAAADAAPGASYQFERLGYFVRDPGEREGASAGADGPGPSSGGGGTSPRPVFNRTVSLRDTWARRAAAREGVEAVEAAEARPDGGATVADRSRAGDAVEVGESRDAGAGGRSRPSRERERAREAHPELAERYRRWQEQVGLPEEDAEILSGDPALARFFEETLEAGADPRVSANWIIHELRGLMEEGSVEELPFGGAAFGELVRLVEERTVSQASAREVLAHMLEEGGSPGAIVEREGLERIDDREELAALVERIVEAHPEEARRYREGQGGLLGFFVGRAMRETDGRADPRLVKGLLRSALAK